MDYRVLSVFVSSISAVALVANAYIMAKLTGAIAMLRAEMFEKFRLKTDCDDIRSECIGKQPKFTTIKRG